LLAIARIFVDWYHLASFLSQPTELQGHEQP